MISSEEAYRINLVNLVVPHEKLWEEAMAVAERMTATKGAILSLLTDAYQRRDRVGVRPVEGDAQDRFR